MEPFPSTATTSGGWLLLRGQEAAANWLILGTTGSGKSRLEASLFVQCLNQGVACCLLDPHGDLYHLILGILADQGFFHHPDAFRRLLAVDLSGRSDRYVPFNVLNQPQYAPHTLARLVWEAFTRTWPSLAEGAAPNMENLVLAGVHVLIENHLPLTYLTRVLTDQAYRNRLLPQVRDAEIVDFFRLRFDTWGTRRAALLSESTLRRLFLLTYQPALRFSLGQKANRLNARLLMDAQVSLLCNLANLDPDSQRLLGSLITASFEQAALSRADITEEARWPYTLLLDEFGMFSAQSPIALEHILTQARKFGLALIMAAQVWSQTKRLHAALQNANLVALRLGREDAQLVTPQLFTPDPYRIKHAVSDAYGATRSHPLYMSGSEQRAEFEQVLQTLPPREAFVRVGTQTHRIRTVLVSGPHTDRVALAAIEERYAQLLLTPRAQIELLATTGTPPTPPPPRPNPTAGDRSYFTPPSGAGEGGPVGSGSTQRRRATPLEEPVALDED